MQVAKLVWPWCHQLEMESVISSFVVSEEVLKLSCFQYTMSLRCRKFSDNRRDQSFNGQTVFLQHKIYINVSWNYYRPTTRNTILRKIWKQMSTFYLPVNEADIKSNK